MGGAPAGPARSNGAPARSATALRAGARADANVMDLAEADDRPPRDPRRLRLSEPVAKALHGGIGRCGRPDDRGDHFDAPVGPAGASVREG